MTSSTLFFKMEIHGPVSFLDLRERPTYRDLMLLVSSVAIWSFLLEKHPMWWPFYCFLMHPSHNPKPFRLQLYNRKDTKIQCTLADPFGRVFFQLSLLTFFILFWMTSQHSLFYILFHQTLASKPFFYVCCHIPGDIGPADVILEVPALSPAVGLRRSVPHQCASSPWVGPTSHM